MACFRRRPDGELVVVGKACHAPSDPGMGEAIVAATDRLAAFVG